MTYLVSICFKLVGFMHIFLLIGFSRFQSVNMETQNENMEQAFMEHEVVPDVIMHVPTEKLELSWGDVKADLGNTLTPIQVQNPPTVGYAAEDDGFYTLIMNGPDAPTRSLPKLRSYHHWLVVNIPGGDVTKGEVMSEYVRPGPPKDTGLHRYVFLLFKQPTGKMTFQDLPKIISTSAVGRLCHSVEQFASTYVLDKPQAGNFFQAEY